MTIARLVLIASLSILATSLPFAADAHPAQRVHKVAVLGVATAAGYALQIEAFRRGLRELGYVEEKNIVLDFRWAEGSSSRLSELAAELIRRKPDVLVTSGPGTAVAMRATTTIPIVMAAAGNAVESGLVKSLARPGGNVTGSSFFFRELSVKRLEMIKETLPQLSRVGILLNAGNPANTGMLQTVEAAALKLKVQLQVVEVRSSSDFVPAFAALVKGGAESLLVAEHTVFVADAARLADLARAHRIPAIGFVQIADHGGLLAFGVDFPALWHRAASFVDKILKGAKPAELPVEQPMRFEVVVNSKAAKELGVAIPASVMVRADRIIQ